MSEKEMKEAIVNDVIKSMLEKGLKRPSIKTIVLETLEVLEKGRWSEDE